MVKPTWDLQDTYMARATANTLLTIRGCRTVGAIARRADLARESINNYENAKRLPSLRSLRRLSFAYKISLTELVTKIDQEYQRLRNGP